MNKSIKINWIFSHTEVQFNMIHWVTPLPNKIKQAKKQNKTKTHPLIVEFLLSNRLLYKGQLFCKMCLKRTLSFSKFAVAKRLLYISAWKVRTDSKLVSIGKNPCASMELNLFTSTAFLAFWEQDFIVVIIIIILKATKTATFSATKQKICFLQLASVKRKYPTFSLVIF